MKTLVLMSHGRSYIFHSLQPSGYLLSPLILDTFAVHFGTAGINADPITCKCRPVGALALTLAAVSVPLVSVICYLTIL